MIRSLAVGLFLILTACNVPTSTEYDRDSFGSPWVDTDRNGCDTRNDILARDLTDIRKTGACRVVDGKLKDPYDGRVVLFKDGIQIDHVVSLKDAWESGAKNWSSMDRVQFANDPKNLVATSEHNNQAKSAKTPGEWMPKTDECRYLNTYVEVKLKYGLDIKDDVLSLRDKC